MERSMDGWSKGRKEKGRKGEREGRMERSWEGGRQGVEARAGENVRVHFIDRPADYSYFSAQSLDWANQLQRIAPISPERSHCNSSRKEERKEGGREKEKRRGEKEGGNGGRTKNEWMEKVAPETTEEITRHQSRFSENSDRYPRQPPINMSHQPNHLLLDLGPHWGRILQ